MILSMLRASRCSHWLPRRCHIGVPLPPVASSSSRRSSTTSSLQSQQQQQVIVVRHGETDWNKTLRVQGSTDIPLNIKGRAQAVASAQALQHILQARRSGNSSNIYSSPLSRAHDTAVAIANGTPTAVTTADALREWDLGALEGLTNAAEEFPDDWKIFKEWANPEVSLEMAQIPLTGNGESMEDVRWRAVTFMEEVAREQHIHDIHEPILCVSHGGVLGQLLRHVVQTTTTLTTTLPEYPPPGNACISKFWLDFSVDDTTPEWTIESWADTSHLTGDLAPIGVDYERKQ